MINLRVNFGFVFFLLFFVCGQVIAQENDTHPGNDANRSLSGALDHVSSVPSENTRTKSKLVLFVTNRKLDPAAVAEARSRNKVLRYEDVFLNSPDIAMSYGWALISYPTFRKRGDQNYELNSSYENPLFDFSIVDHFVANSPDDFARNVKHLFPDNHERSLIFVHGIDNSFSDGAERMAQLALDLHLKGIPVLFSWPSDNERYFPAIPFLGMSSGSYKRVVQISHSSRQYLARAIKELISVTQNPFDIIAHSMGTDLASNAIILDKIPANLIATASSGGGVPLPTLILAAPDISTRDFSRNLRTKIIKRADHVTMYCSEDRALKVSQDYNESDERLGYCDSKSNKLMSGIDIVSVSGIREFARHSYYLSSIPILDDIEQLLANPSNLANETIPQRREIRIE